MEGSQWLDKPFSILVALYLLRQDTVTNAATEERVYLGLTVPEGQSLWWQSTGSRREAMTAKSSGPTSGDTLEMARGF